MMIRQQMVCVICVYGLQTGRTEAEKEAFREETCGEVGRSERYRICCALRAISVHTSVWLSQGTKKASRKIWMGNKEQGRARTGGDVEEERVGSSGHVLPEEGEPQNHPQERTAQNRARPTGGAETAAQAGEGLQSVGGRVC